MTKFSKKEKKSFFAGIRVGKKNRKPRSSPVPNIKQSSRDITMAERYADHMAVKFNADPSIVKREALKSMRTDKNFRKELYKQYDVESYMKVQRKAGHNV